MTRKSLSAMHAGGLRWNSTAATTETLAHVLSNGEKVLFQNRETSKKIHVLGVAHASEKGAETVRQHIRELKPSVVVLPLCNMRYTAMIENKPLIPEEVLVRIHCCFSTADPK